VDVERAELRYREDIGRQVPVEPEYQQHVWAVCGKQTWQCADAAGQQEIHARRDISENRFRGLKEIGLSSCRRPHRATH